ncbi:MAG TPA: carbohydrate kinase family protein [Anaeromyxobacter sp.]|nr:carbohydrate kinase family protein [Anaeromyxobacter sp.]
MRISGVGCCVLDALYDVSPGEGEACMARHLSREHGDGGLVRGAAVLRRSLEAFAGRPVAELVAEIGGGAPANLKLGGVAAAAAIAAAQLLSGEGIEVRLYGNLSDDEDGALVRRLLARTPVSTDRMGTRAGRFPRTYILNDRDAHGHGERSFICETGTSEALAVAPGELDRDFFRSEVTLFSAMWWEPLLHADLTRLLRECKRAGSVTVVSTAFDPARGPVRSRWALGDSDEAYRYVDALVMDRAEALLHSGEADLGPALDFYRRAGVGACVVTQGVDPVHYWSRGGTFARADGQLPIPEAILRDKATGELPTGDSVGCGDNFAGGMVASIALQLRGGRGLSLPEAVFLGNLAGGIASTHSGGVLDERRPGEKRELVERYRRPYQAQLAGVGAGLP